MTAFKPPSSLAARFPESSRHPDFKKSNLKQRALLFDFGEQSANRRAAHGDFGSSELMTPYRSRSVFASSVRPSASSASAVTWELSLVQGWVGPRALSWAARAVCPSARASVGAPLRTNRQDRPQRARLVSACSATRSSDAVAISQHATARQDQAGQSRSHTRTWYRYRD
jgi:hypothetical protein